MNRTFSLTAVLLVIVGMQGALCEAEDPSSAAPAPEAASAPRQDWMRTGQSRLGWKWLAEHYDQNADGAVTQNELRVSQDVFVRLDRTWDGKLSAADFEWSKEGLLTRQKETTFALFKSVDANSDGRISSDEFQAVFAKVAGDKQYLNEEELERLIYLPRVLKTAAEEKLRLGRSEFSPARQRTGNQVPQPGEMAPDFELASPDGQTTVRLSSFRGKRPVVLVFGSFTCGNYRTYTESLEELYRFWKKDAEFVRVYVREAHPVADEQAATSTNARAGILIKQPTTFEERCTVAKRFSSTLQVQTPLVVDGIDNHVGEAYGAVPDRLYVVDRDGRIAFAGGPGPFGFNPREMEQSLVLMLLAEDESALVSR
jgi:Ca2+-binding EF-hand superfamily protein/thiol-disulfide isomerase/thioredoxin